MKSIHAIILVLLTLGLNAQELSKKKLKIEKDSISFALLQQITANKQFTFIAGEQEFLGSSIKLTKDEISLTIFGDSLYVFMPFPNSFDPALITDTRNLEFMGNAEKYVRKVNEKQQHITIKFQYKYLATAWEFILSIEKDKSSSLWIKTEQGAQIKFIGETTENQESN